jgi:glyoxylase I family protein
LASPDRKILLLDMGDGSHMELFQPTDNSPKADDASPNDPITHFAIATTDTRAAVERIREAGYEVTLEPRDVDLGNLKATIAFFNGPSGEVIEFFQTH